MEVSTTQYEFSHGKKPRGFGTWGFFFDGKRDADQAFWFSGSYGNAAARCRWRAHLLVLSHAGRREALDHHRSRSQLDDALLPGEY